MANQIRITPDEMRQSANAYRKEEENVGEIIRKMDHLLAELMNNFEGDASKAFEGRYEELRPSFEKAAKLIGEIASALDTTAKVYEETDGKIAGLLNGR